MIDAHVHLWAENCAEYPRVNGARDYPPPSFTAEDFLAHARPNGVTRAVLVQMSFYGFDNSYMLDAIRKHPGVFSGIAVVDENGPHPDAAMKALAGQGVRGFRITPGDAPRIWLETAGMQTMWRCGAGERLAMCTLLNPDALDALDGMCTRFPDTPVVIDHLARIGADGPIREDDVQSLLRLARHGNVSVKVSAFYALGRKQAPYTDLVPLIRAVFETYGPQRLMWASDCPFQVEDGHTYAASVELVREHLDFVSDPDRAWLFRRTAESLFFVG